VEVAGDRKEHYQAESNVWKLVTHVLKEREMAAVRTALAALERALGEVREAALDGDPTVRAQARTRVRRLQQLIELSRAALHVLRLLVDSARADVGPLKALSEMLSGRRGG
jgi:DNA-binding transcriptional regulator GbsR (MarR family)